MGGSLALRGGIGRDEVKGWGNHSQTRRPRGCKVESKLRRQAGPKLNEFQYQFRARGLPEGTNGSLTGSL